MRFPNELVVGEGGVQGPRGGSPLFWDPLMLSA